MREEIARYVFPVFTTGVQRKQELLAGAPLDFATVQSELAGLLQATAETKPWVDPGHVVKGFLGIQFALTCWVDDLFNDSPWRERWDPEILEYKYFRTRLRGELFWEQCKLAELLTTTDTLEVFYLCVVLGFRGNLAHLDAPGEGKLKEWCDKVRGQLERSQPTDFELPVQMTPRTFVPALKGSDQFRRMRRVLIACVLALVPVFAFLVVYLNR
jgi:type VI secretion system protein ImpK